MTASIKRDCVDSICGSDEDLDDGYADKDGDCDDMNPDVNPRRREVYYNDLDDDRNPTPMTMIKTVTGSPLR